MLFVIKISQMFMYEHWIKLKRKINKHVLDIVPCHHQCHNNLFNAHLFYWLLLHSSCVAMVRQRQRHHISVPDSKHQPIDRTFSQRCWTFAQYFFVLFSIIYFASMFLSHIKLQTDTESITTLNEEDKSDMCESNDRLTDGDTSKCKVPGDWWIKNWKLPYFRRKSSNK